MAHLTFEYTANIREEAKLPDLLAKAHEVILGQDGVFPPGGVRSRAVELTDYRMADGAADYAFVHATFKIGAGHPPAVKKKVCDELFEMMKAHFADLYAKRDLALSMELYEFDEAGTYKHNNVHARFRK
ncbi:MAG: 5-carboxymethyl-2-hydroxymuconate Delta-isomerase [Steroidobacteraceae bacterium]